MVGPGAVIDVTVDRPVAGGRMLARHEGGVVLVAGTIPGERVRARVTRASRNVTFADTFEVLDASPDRREPGFDPACGGSLYAHIRYERQLQLKAEVIADAASRIGRLALPALPAVVPSPESGYRLRAKLHVRHGQAGFFREGTHEICEAGVTGQLRPDALEAARSVMRVFDTRLAGVDSLIVAENVPATERVVHLDLKPGARMDNVCVPASACRSMTGITTSLAGRVLTLAGQPAVTDRAADLTGSATPLPAAATWTRQAPAFFQANRYLIGRLIGLVLEAAAGERTVDLYAGVGLFAVACAAAGSQVVAVEGDRLSGSDLIRNAGPWRDRLRVVRARVEAVVAHVPEAVPDTVILDPPRAGASREAVTGLLAWRVPRVVHVSCDPPTFARDAARLVEAGYTLRSLEALDLFPNTPHVEVVAVFTRS